MAVAWNEGRGIGVVTRREPSVLALRTRRQERRGQNRPLTRSDLRVIPSIHPSLTDRRMRSDYFAPETEFIRTERNYADEQGPDIAARRHKALADFIPRDQLDVWNPDFRLSPKTAEAIVDYKNRLAKPTINSGIADKDHTELTPIEPLLNEGAEPDLSILPLSGDIVDLTSSEQPVTREDTESASVHFG